MTLCLVLLGRRRPSGRCIERQVVHDRRAWETDATLAARRRPRRSSRRLTYTFNGGPFTRRHPHVRRGRLRASTASARDAGRRAARRRPRPGHDQRWLRVAAPGPDERHRRRPTSFRYTVRDAADVGSDVAELYWDFTGEDHPGSVPCHDRRAPAGDSPNATPDTPADDASVVRAWGHGPSNGTVTLGQSLVTAPWTTCQRRSSSSCASSCRQRHDRPRRRATRASPTCSPRRASSSATSARSRRSPTRGTGRSVSSPARSPRVLGLLGLGGSGASGAASPKPEEVLGEYWREPLDDPPAVVVATMGKGSVDRPKAIASTLMDMAQRGYIRISADERGKEHTFHWMGKQFGPDVRPFERQLLDLVFRGQTVMAEEDLTRWARAEPPLGVERDDRLGRRRRPRVQGPRLQHRAARQADAGADRRVRGDRCDRRPGAAAQRRRSASWRSRSPSWCSSSVRPRSATAPKRVPRRTRRRRGSRVPRRTSRSSTRRRSGHLILWERFLVYSVALGVSGDLVRNIAFKVPEVANDPAFAVWYVGHGPGRFDSIGPHRRRRLQSSPARSRRRAALDPVAVSPAAAVVAAAVAAPGAR